MKRTFGRCSGATSGGRVTGIADLVFGTYPSWSHLVVRVALGVIFFAHGGQKLFGWFGGPGLSRTVEAFARDLRLPAAATVLAAVTECFGGAALVIGFLARPAALGVAIIMTVAIATVHARHGFFLNLSMTPGKGHGYEFDLALLAMAVSILVGGAGALSVDHLLVPWGE